MEEDLLKNMLQSFFQIACEKAKIKQLIQQKRLLPIDFMVHDLLVSETTKRKEICNKLNISRMTLHRSIDRLRKAEVSVSPVIHSEIITKVNVSPVIHFIIFVIQLLIENTEDLEEANKNNVSPVIHSKEANFSYAKKFLEQALQKHLENQYFLHRNPFKKLNVSPVIHFAEGRKESPELTESHILDNTNFGNVSPVIHTQKMKSVCTPRKPAQQHAQDIIFLCKKVANTLKDLLSADNLTATNFSTNPKKEGFPPLYIPPFQERKDCVSHINTHTRNTYKDPNKKQVTDIHKDIHLGETPILNNTDNIAKKINKKNNINNNSNGKDCNDLKVGTDTDMCKKEQNEVLFKEYEELLELTQRSDPTPYKKIVELYNTICESLPKVVKLTEQRKRMLKSRWKEYPSLDYFRKVFELAEESDFLSGRRGDWQANFDWLIRPSNFTKVLEGAYTNPDERKQKIYEKKKKRLLGGNPTTEKKNGNGEKEMSAEEKQKFEEKLRELFKGTGLV